jgi:diguanylate cyclase (GGDEF)-like protein
MPNDISLQRQIDELTYENQSLSAELKTSFATAHELRIEAFHNEILSALINERFNLSTSQHDCAEQQTRFLQTFSDLCQSNSICIYQLDNTSGYFNLQSYYSRQSRRPQKQFICTDSPSYVSNMMNSYCNFVIAPMRYASGMNDIHWYFDKDSGRAILVSHDTVKQNLSMFDSLTAKILRTALQLYQDIQVKDDFATQLVHQATIDPMTELPNRTLAFDRLGQAMVSRANENKIVFAMFVDIAHFKDINETFGHETGDKVLGIIAKRIRDAVRESDTVARLSGDEFLIILENANKAKAAEVVSTNVLAAISEPLIFQGRELLVSSNIGISAYPSDGEDASVLIQNADAAMSQSRKMGLNHFQFYTQAMNEEAAHRLAIETGLKKALLNNEFTLHYQPLVEIASGCTVTVEALLRWHSATLGFVSPDEFISIAEEDGLIIPIGYWVIEEVCRQLNSWKKEGISNLTVAINVSVRQLQDPGFVDKLMSILKTNNIPSSKVELEITEGILISDVAGADSVLTLLHALGFKLSLDDFGTGYSALSYLNNYHFDNLKIDRSFITNLVKNDKDKALIDAIVAMAHKLNLKVIAEGVEHEEELAYLQSQKCDYIQGFYFSRPVPASQITRQFFGEGLLPV